MKLSRRLLISRASLLGASVLSPFPLLAQSNKAKTKRPKTSSRELVGPLRRLALFRLSYGAAPLDEMAFTALGSSESSRYQHWLDLQLEPQHIDDANCEKRISALNLESLDLPLKKLWLDYQQEGKKEKIAAKEVAGKDTTVQVKEARNLQQEPASETEIMTWMRAVHSKKQLQESMVEFWHDHFNVDAYNGQKIPPIFPQYDRDVIRKNAFGNFRKMLEESAKNPVMLFYLDNFVNQSGNPNENYARELFELHTLGAEHYLGVLERSKVPKLRSGQPIGYVDGDVYEAARCFTGWRVDTGNKSKETGEFLYQDQNHDRFQKIVLANNLPELEPPLKDAERALDILVHHPKTALHIALKMCRRFVSDNPPQSLIEKMGQTFSANLSAPDQIAKMIDVMCTSKEFLQSAGLKFKRPFDHSVSFLRTTGAQFEPPKQFLRQQAAGGQRRFAWRTPDGYPEIGPRWAGSQQWLEKAKITQAILANRFEGIRIDPLEIYNSEESVAAILQRWGTKFVGAPLFANELHELTLVFSDQNRSQKINKEQFAQRAPQALAMLALAPSFQWR